MYTLGVVVLVRVVYGLRVPRRLAVSREYFKQSKWPTWPQNTQTRRIDHTYAQQDIRVCEYVYLKRPKRQLPNPKAIRLLRVSI